MNSVALRAAAKCELLFNKSSFFVAALGVTKFIIVTNIIWVNVLLESDLDIQKITSDILES